MFSNFNRFFYLNTLLSIGSSTGLAVLMAMVNVVLQWKTPITYQNHNNLFDLKFGNCDYVKRFNNSAQFGDEYISGSTPTLW